MTREEAIAWFENWLLDYYDIDDMPQELTAELAGIALSAIRQQELLSNSKIVKSWDMYDEDGGEILNCETVTNRNGLNEPLTLDEMRNMDGEPVWCISMLDKSEEWGIMRVVETSKAWFIAISGASRAFGDKDTYGKTWLAYRHKPEEGTV